jgi:hypothetical protein
LPEFKEPNWWFNLFFAAKDNLELNYIRIANDTSLDFSLVLFSNVSLAKKLFLFSLFPMMTLALKAQDDLKFTKYTFDHRTFFF